MSAGPNPDHPTGSALCLKGKAAPEILYSPDRILQPMRRTTPKTDTDPKWETISWEEALSEVASKLSAIKDEFGAEAVAFSITSPSGSTVSDGIDWIERFIRTFGSPNTAYATELCNWHKDHAHKFTFGTGVLYPEYTNSDTILLWGFNPSAVWLDQATQIATARARGAKIISIDPRDAGFARDADHWLRVLPGTDAALAMGLANILLQREAYDDEFVRLWTNAPFLVRQDNGQFLRGTDLGDARDDGYVIMDKDGVPRVLSGNVTTDKQHLLSALLTCEVDISLNSGRVACNPAFDLYKAACAEYDLKRVSVETTIAQSDILAAADTLIKADAIAYYAWTGVGQHAHATQTDRAIATLMALKGSYDKPGGNVAYTKHTTNPATGWDQFPDGQLEKAIGLDKRPIGPPSQGWITASDLYTAISESKPYPVRGLMVFGANLAVSHPESIRAKEALAQLDFHVHCDAVETPTARLADIFLPISTMWEREGLRVGFEVSQDAEELIQLRQPIVPPLGDTKSDTEIVFDLACRLGMGKHFYDGDIDAALNHVLEPTGLTVDALRAEPSGVRLPLNYQPKKYALPNGQTQRGFDTDTGRVELYSELLLRNGHDPLPSTYSAGPELKKDELILTTAKSGYYTHSAQRHIPTLRKRFPDPTVEVSSEFAQRNKLESGEIARIKTAYGEVRMVLKINAALHPSVAVASYGWWQANQEIGKPGYDAFSAEGANYNNLISGSVSDPISGAPAMRSTRCFVEPLKNLDRPKDGWEDYVDATITNVQDLADGVKAISVSPRIAKALPDYLPGQHITLKLRDPDTGAEVIRCYSLTGPARQANRDSYDIAVRKVDAPVGQPDVPDGKMSGIVHSSLQVGHSVWLKAPSGRFVPPITSERPVVLVAGGIGITPFISYLESLLTVDAPPVVHLVYANQNSSTHAFAERITELQTELDTLSVVNVYDNPLDEDLLHSRCQATGFVTIEQILLPTFGTDPEIFQCGPPAMMDSVEHGLRKAGFPMDRLHKEAFVSPAATNALPNGPFSVTFVRSGATVDWTPASGSILELSESLGLSLQSGCRAGQCESCTQKILSGSTMYRTDLEYSEDDRCLTCQAVPTSDLVLDA